MVLKKATCELFHWAHMILTFSLLAILICHQWNGSRAIPFLFIILFQGKLNDKNESKRIHLFTKWSILDSWRCRRFSMLHYSKSFLNQTYGPASGMPLGDAKLVLMTRHGLIRPRWCHFAQLHSRATHNQIWYFPLCFYAHLFGVRCGHVRCFDQLTSGAYYLLNHIHFQYIFTTRLLLHEETSNFFVGRRPRVRRSCNSVFRWSSHTSQSRMDDTTWTETQQSRSQNLGGLWI